MGAPATSQHLCCCEVSRLSGCCQLPRYLSSLDLRLMSLSAAETDLQAGRLLLVAVLLCVQRTHRQLYMQGPCRIYPGLAVVGSTCGVLILVLCVGCKVHGLAVVMTNVVTNCQTRHPPDVWDTRGQHHPFPRILFVAI